MSVYEKHLENGLVLRTVRNEDDVERFIALNATVTNEGLIAERLLRHHPETGYDDYVLVVNEQTHEAVSTTCLLPWRCNYEGIELKVAMLEMVVTRPEYRRRGLVRAQIEHFHQIVLERGFDLCIIQGIPYYYRQYGYSYALDHTPVDSLPVWQVPDGPAELISAYQLRPATLNDIDELAQLYSVAMNRNGFYVQRSSQYWRYLLQQRDYPVRLLTQRHTDRPVGYICVFEKDRHLRIYESSIAGYEAGLAVLRQLKTETSGDILIAGSPVHRLVRLARTLGSKPLPGDQWLWRVPDVTNLLRKIGPVLEQRLADANCADLTITLCLNFYRQAYALNFEAGKLAVTSLGFVDASMGADGGDLCIPPDAFIRLLFGYRSLEQLQDAWPDIRVKPATRYLWELLYPPLEAHIVMPY